MSVEIMRAGWLDAWRHLQSARAELGDATTTPARCLALVNMGNAARTFQVACDGYTRALEGEDFAQAKALALQVGDEIRGLRADVAAIKANATELPGEEKP